MTQARLATLLEFDPRVYNRWERGTTTQALVVLLDNLIKRAQMSKVLAA